MPSELCGSIGLYPEYRYPIMPPKILRHLYIEFCGDWYNAADFYYNFRWLREKLATEINFFNYYWNARLPELERGVLSSADHDPIEDYSSSSDEISSDSDYSYEYITPNDFDPDFIQSD